MLNRENLVVLKPFITACYLNDVAFKPNHFYRCVRIEGEDTYIVYGTNLAKRDVENCFESAHDRVLRDFLALGLIKQKEGQMPTFITKKEFKELVHVGNYTGQGFRKRPLRILHVGHPKECMYAFYPMQDTLANNFKETYENYRKLVEGDMEPLDDEDVMFGNCGIPIGYGKIRVR